MNSLLYILTAVSALSSQLYSTPSCSGPGCQSNSSAGATWSQSSNRNTDSRQYSQFSDPRHAAACQCRTCDPRFPCSPENCGRQNCQDCVNGCQDCETGQFAAQSNNGWEPRANDLQRRPSTPRVSVQRLCPVTGEELGSMGPPIPVTVSGRTIQVCCEACVAAVKRNPAKYFAKVAEEMESAARRPDMNSRDQFSPRPQASAQRLCPVTGEELGSMGPPIPVTVSGRTIQVCCEACVAAVRRNPAKYFAQVERDRNSDYLRPASSGLISGRVLR